MFTSVILTQSASILKFVKNGYTVIGLYSTIIMPRPKIGIYVQVIISPSPIQGRNFRSPDVRDHPPAYQAGGAGYS